MSAKGTASSRRIIVAERREQAWALRRRGYSYRAIAEELSPQFGDSYSKSQAERDIKHALDELNNRTLETAAEARALDLARLDDLLVAWFSDAIRETASNSTAEDDTASTEAADATEATDTTEAADPMEELDKALKKMMLSKQAAEIVFKALEQRAKLLGLHRQELALTTPEPLQVSADLSGIDEEGLDAIVRNLTAALSAGQD